MVNDGKCRAIYQAWMLWVKKRRWISIIDFPVIQALTLHAHPYRRNMSSLQGLKVKQNATYQICSDVNFKYNQFKWDVTCSHKLIHPKLHIKKALEVSECFSTSVESHLLVDQPTRKRSLKQGFWHHSKNKQEQNNRKQNNYIYPSCKLTLQAGISPSSIGNTSSLFFIQGPFSNQLC